MYTYLVYVCVYIVNNGAILCVCVCVCISVAAHKDGIWGVAWARNVATGNDIVVTGSVDSVVKAWIW